MSSPNRPFRLAAVLLLVLLIPDVDEEEDDMVSLLESLPAVDEVDVDDPVDSIVSHAMVWLEPSAAA